ncbi:MAG: hypothetical protein P4M05_30010 [Bradyrhizobium sp.]|nr:hypothetical protein [Bradyrhizobium sp.]
MHTETLLRKLRLQKALSEDELNAYLKKVKSDGSLPPGEILILLELMMQRTECLSIEDIKAVSGLVGGNCRSGENAKKCDEDDAMRAIISKLKK